MKTVIGIDPGLSGAVAVVADYGVRVWPMPIAVPKGSKRTGYDVAQLAKMLREIASRGSWLPDARAVGCVAYIERLWTMHREMGGAIANFNRGRAAVFEGILAALGVPYVLVAPQTWQREMLMGHRGPDTKARSLAAAKRLYPAVSLYPTPRSRKESDGCSDALLIATHGRRMLEREQAAGKPNPLFATEAR